MTEKSDQAVTPEEGYLAIEGGFFGYLGERFADRGPELEQTIRAHQAGIEERHGPWVEDGQSRFHLRFGALVLAGYRALSETLPQGEALALLREAVVGPSRPWMLEGTKAALDRVPDPFALMTAISKDKEAGYYGRTFVWERPQDDGHAYLPSVTRCFWHGFALANGAPEIMPTICDFDTNWMDAVDPGRHGFRVERPTTLGYGGDRCRFWFIRKAPAADDAGAARADETR